jgi:hypothetical protein
VIGWLLVSFVVGATAAPDLEIHASLSGYNLLLPEGRCCGFDLLLSPDGNVAITLHVSRGQRKKRLRLSAAQLSSLRRTLNDADFFSLPQSVGEMPVDGDRHRMTIRIGSRSHTINLYECPSARNDGLPEVRRACAVWESIRELVDDPEARVR